MSQQTYGLEKHKKNGYKFHLPGKQFVQYHGKKARLLNPKPRLALFSHANLLGKGCFGEVYEARIYKINYKLETLTYTRNGKVVKVLQDIDTERKNLIYKEYNLVKKIARIGMKPPVFTGSQDQETCYLVMKRLPGKELGKLDIQSLSLDKKLELIYELLRALRAQVTNCGIVHRDIKPENILVVLVPEIRINIIDYGLAKKAGKQDGTHSGTPLYAAPEIMKGQSHDVACDVYSMAKTISNLPDNPYKEPAALKNLLDDMLEPNPNKRISINKAIAKFESSFPAQKIIINSRLELKQLNKYSNKIRNKYPKDAEIIDDFTDNMEQILYSQKDIISIKKECSDFLRQNQEIRACAQKHKQVEYIIKNLSITICSLGLSCIAAYMCNRKLGFFQNPVREVLDNIEKEINTSAAPAA